MKRAIAEKVKRTSKGSDMKQCQYCYGDKNKEGVCTWEKCKSNKK